MSEELKPHEMRELVNRLTSVAKTFAGTEQLREQISEEIAKSLSRPAPAVQVPEGWKLVPVKLTDEMVEAAGFECQPRKSAYAVGQYCWDALLAATPSSPSVATCQGKCVGDSQVCAARHGNPGYACACQCHKQLHATVATEAVAQGGGVDVEKVMALVDEYGAIKYRDGTRGAKRWPHDTKAKLREIRALLSASPAASGCKHWTHVCDMRPVGYRVITLSTTSCPECGVPAHTPAIAKQEKPE